MFSTKKNVLQTVALLKAHGIDHIVISPGSRNAPLAHCFSQDPFFRCFSIVDERSAAYFALGLIQKLGKPVAVCCTSGTAILNQAPAVAEAFYQELPLVVVSADRSPSWIGQMDGQTIPQQNVFGSMSAKSVQLPEIHTEEDLWHCNRLVNEALNACIGKNKPVHINVPISEPLFDFSELQLPKVRKIKTVSADRLSDINDFTHRWNAASKRMILLGQMPQNRELRDILENIAAKQDCLILCEHLSNAVSPAFIGNFDALLYGMTDTEAEALGPDLLITLGGHIVSKRIKKFLRKYQPSEHWSLSPNGNEADTFQCLTDLIETEPLYFFKKLECQKTNTADKTYANLWSKASARVSPPGDELPFSDIAVVGSFLKAIPGNSSLFVGNSSSVRNIQLYPMPEGTKVFCNRGTNGIEGSICTASGYAALNDGLTFLLMGDLSFFYDLNGLWNKYIGENFRIILINNGGGGIFQLLPGLDKSEALSPFIAANHHESAENWVSAAGFSYLKADNETELKKNLAEFVSPSYGKSIVLEVFTNADTNKSASDLYYKKLKK